MERQIGIHLGVELHMKEISNRRLSGPTSDLEGSKWR